MEVTFNISIIMDNIHEGNESFKLAVVKRSLPNRVNCGDGDPCAAAAVTIVDTSSEWLIMW